MISALLYFVLGFAIAALLAIFLAPIAVRRAVTLTRRQIEANLPLSIEEIRAEKDKVRAQLAMDIRRLEMDRDTANRARVRHEINAQKFDEQRREAFELRDDMKSQLAVKVKELSETSTQLTQANEGLEERDQELTTRREQIEALDKDLQAALRTGEELEMDVATLTVTHEELQSNLNIAFDERNTLDDQLRDLRAKLKASQTDLREARRDTTDAEKRFARMEKRADMLEEKLLSRKATTSRASVKKTEAELKVVKEPQKNSEKPVAVKNTTSKNVDPKIVPIKAKTPNIDADVKINPKKNSLLQQSVGVKTRVSTMPKTMPKVAPLEINPLDTNHDASILPDDSAHFETLKDELKAIGEGKVFDRTSLEEKLQQVAASMSANAMTEEGMEDIFSTFESRAAKAPAKSLARDILDAKKR